MPTNEQITAHEFEVLGRLLHELWRGGRNIQDCYDWLDYWRKGWPGGGWVLEWKHGPFADELYEMLLAANADEEAGSWLPVDIVTDAEHAARRPRERLWLRVDGVPIELRAIEPLGAEQALTRRLSSIGRAAPVG